MKLLTVNGLARYHVSGIQGGPGNHAIARLDIGHESIGSRVESQVQQGTSASTTRSCVRIISRDSVGTSKTARTG